MKSQFASSRPATLAPERTAHRAAFLALGLTLIHILTAPCAGAAGGTVNFANNNSLRVTNGITGNPVALSDAIRAALYWAPLGSNTFVQIGESAIVGLPGVGLYAGGTRFAGDGTPGGASGRFQVRAWSGGFATYELAFESGTALVGESETVEMPTGNPGAAPPTPPASLCAAGLTGIMLREIGTSWPGWLRGPANDVVEVNGAYKGWLAYVAQGGAGLAVFDVNNPTNPVVIGGCDTSGYAEAVAVHPAYATVAVADGNAGLQIFSDYFDATLVWDSSYDTSGYAFDVALGYDGEYGLLAYVADGSAGLQIIEANLGGSSNAARLAVCDTPGTAYGVAVVDSAGTNLAFVADGNAGLQIIDATDPTTPVRRGGYDTSGSARGVAVVGHWSTGWTAYVADGEAGLQVIDVTNPDNPVRLGGYNTSGEALDVAVRANRAYVADRYGGVQVIDVSNPANPARLGGYTAGGWAHAICASAHWTNLVYTASQNAGLEVIDVSEATNSYLVGGFNNSGEAKDVAIAGNLAYVADGYAGLQIIDLTHPSGPTRIGGFDTNYPNAYQSAEALVVVSNRAFIANREGGLQIVDVSNPANPALLGFASGDFIGVAVLGNTAYTLNRSRLNKYDVSNPAGPVLGTYQDWYPEEARGVAVAGDRIYLVDEFGYLGILNATDLSYLGEHWNLTYPARGISVVGDLAYVADGGGLKIIDVSNPASPVPVGSCGIGGSGLGVTLSGNLAYVASGSGVAIVDISNPASPVLQNRIDTGRIPYNVAVSQSHVCVAEGPSGLYVLPRLPDTTPQPTIISVLPLSQTVELASNATFTVAASGASPLGYQWYFGTDAIPGGTGADLTLHNVTWTNAGSYHVVVANAYGSATSAPVVLTVVDTTPPSITTCASNRTLAAVSDCQVLLPGLIIEVVAADASGMVTVTQAPPAGTVLGLGPTDVTFTARDSSGNTNHCVATVTVAELNAPTIQTHPGSCTKVAGQPASFSVTATTPCTPLSYRWQFNGADLEDGPGRTGTTSSTLSLASVQSGDAGSYRCVVSNGWGNTASEVAVLTVVVPPSVATLQATAITASNATLNASVVPNDASASVYFRYGLTDTYGSYSATNLVVASNTVSITVSELAPATTYHFQAVAVNSSSAASGADLTLTTPALPSTLVSFQVDVSSVPCYCSAITNVEVRGSFQVPFVWTNGLVLTNDSAAPNTNLYSGTHGIALTPGTVVEYKFIYQDTNSSDLHWEYEPNRSFILAAGAQTLTDTFFNRTGARPTIAIQPQSCTKVPGESASFSVSTPACTPLSYQWQLNGTNLVDGAGRTGTTSNVLSLASVQSSDAGSYRCVVTNIWGRTDSDVAVLGMLAPPAVTTLPASEVTGSSATLSASVAPNDVSAAVYFRYGLTTGYGSYSATNTIVSSNMVSVSVSGLAPGTIYHFQAVAVNRDGTSSGGDMTVTTLGTSAGPVTFQVNMSYQISQGWFAPGRRVAARGSFNKWGTFDLVHVGDGVYAGAIEVAGLPGDTIDYKYWHDGNGATTNIWESGENRSFNLTGSAQSLPVRYLDDLWSGGAGIPVTFQVDMSAQIAKEAFSTQNDGVQARGSFQSPTQWSGEPEAFWLTNNGGGIYTNTYGISNTPPNSPFTYKFFIATNGVDSGDGYEKRGNRSFVMPAAAETIPVDYFNGEWPVTNLVTFQVDMQYVPGRETITNVDVRGSFQVPSTWTQGYNLTNDPGGTSVYLYTGTFNVPHLPGTVEYYKFTCQRYSSSNPQWENDPDRSLTLLANSQTLPVVCFDNIDGNVILTADTLVTFTVSMTNAQSWPGYSPMITFDETMGVVVNGDWIPWYDWNTPPEAQYYLTNGTSGDYLYSQTVLIPWGYPLKLTYKYGIDWFGLNMDNENAFRTNHIRYIRQLGNYTLPLDTFGWADTEIPLGLIAVGTPSGGHIPVSWLGLPGACLQTSSDIGDPAAWVSHPETAGYGSPIGIYSTNYPTGGERIFFRVFKQGTP